MSFSKFEKKLEGMVEGIFSRAFRAPLQPVELAKKLTRAVEDNRTISVANTFVPNLYKIFVSPTDNQTFVTLGPKLIAELEKYLREFIADRGYKTVGGVVIEIHPDENIKPSGIEITPENAANIPQISPLPGDPITGRIVTFNHNGMQKSQISYILYKNTEIPLADGMTFGRSTTNTVVLSGIEISRNHAEVVQTEEGWLLRDKGSANGTMVNGRLVNSHLLAKDDKIMIGNEILQVK
jgi:hypothetical protein